MKIMRASGDLWSIPWWEDDKCYTGEKISKEEAQKAFLELKKIYDNSWGQQYATYFKDKKVPTNEELSKCHPMFTSILAEGDLYFQYLLSFGLDLHSIREKTLLDRRLIDRLKNKENFSGAEFEVKILAHFIRQGFGIERDCSSGKGNKNCDIRVSRGSGEKNENVFIEITRREDVCFENKKRYEEGMGQLLASLQNEDESCIKDSLEEFMSGKYSLSEEAEIKKVIHKIEEKAGQLPDDGPGLIMIYTPKGLNPGSSTQIFKTKVKELLGKLPHVSAVVLFEAWYIGKDGIHYLINTFLNPKATINISNSETMKVIEKFGVENNC